jgi:hypothetical protein
VRGCFSATPLFYFPVVDFENANKFARTVFSKFTTGFPQLYCRFNQTFK